MSANAWRYCLVLGGGALVGLASVFTDPMWPGWWDVTRHAGAGVVSAYLGLQVTLTKKNGN